MQGLLKEGGKHFSGVDEALLRNIEAGDERRRFYTKYSVDVLDVFLYRETQT